MVFSILATKLEQRTETSTILREDICMMIGGQGGDGTLTVVNLLGRIFRNAGLYIYDARNVLSRIRGGHADGVIRIGVREVYSIGDQVDLLVAFDEEAVIAALSDLSENTVIVFDDSKGQLSSYLRKPGFTVYSAPLGNMAASALRRNIFKNTIAFGILGRLLGLEDKVLREAITARYERRGKEALDSNTKALDMGFEWADKNCQEAAFRIARGNSRDKILSTGNEATAYGFLVAGGRFFVGYPITPATDIMEWLAPRLPKFGGVVKQAEDELSVINMGIGAAYAGARVMVATSGPGQSLMTEGVGHAGEAEIPIVVVECQRVGPSTGEPTKNEQSDLNHVVFGSHGEFPRLVLSPATPADCFEISAQATNLAEKYQMPVFILLDQALCQNSASIDPFDISSIKVERGKLAAEKDLSKLESYKRYEFTDDGVSLRSIPSQQGGQCQVTGNEHNEFGLVSTDRINRLKMMRKRMNKLERAKSELPKGIIHGKESSRVGVIGFGSTYGPILEAMGQLKQRKIDVKYHQIRTIWPLLEDDLRTFSDNLDIVFVVENNYQGQLASLIRSSLTEKSNIVESIIKFDGTSFRPKEIANAVSSFLSSKTGV
jgi:2-oxoglutarate/2-oxoacid ferredoxin oxidoreductase subunit alpha